MQGRVARRQQVSILEMVGAGLPSEMPPSPPPRPHEAGQPSSVRERPAPSSQAQAGWGDKPPWAHTPEGAEQSGATQTA